MNRSTLTLCIMLSACGGHIVTPSLAPRAIEARGDAPAPAPPVAAKPIDPVLAKQIATLSGQIQSGDAAFQRADQEGARALSAGRGAKAGSEAWIAAEQARSAIEAAQQGSTAALTRLDALLIAQSEAQADDATLSGLTELTTAKMEGEAVVARQTERLAALRR